MRRNRQELAIPAAIAIGLFGGLKLSDAGDFVFEDGQLYLTDGGTADVVLADMEGDGDLDIAALENIFVGSEEFGLVQLLFNDGLGNFSAPQTFELGPAVLFALENAFHNMVAGDLDGDLDTDLAYIGSTNPLSLLLNNGDGTLEGPLHTEFFVSPGHLSGLLDIGDLNGDGHLDTDTCDDCSSGVVPAVGFSPRSSRRVSDIDRALKYPAGIGPRGENRQAPVIAISCRQFMNALAV